MRKFLSFCGLCSAAIAMGLAPAQAGVSGYQPPDGEAADPFFVTVLDAYYCSVVAERASGGVGLAKRLPAVKPEDYRALGARIIAEDGTGMTEQERATLPDVLTMTAKFQYDNDLDGFNRSESLMLIDRLPACEQFFVANVRLDGIF